MIRRPGPAHAVTGMRQNSALTGGNVGDEMQEID